MSIFTPGRHGRFGVIAATLLTTTAIAVGPVRAQDATTAVTGAEAAPVVVESTRIPTELDKTGASVTVITAQDIKEAQDRSVLDSLQRVPGLNIAQNGGFGAQASVFMRGAGSQQTLVLIDGVEVNDPSASSGGFNFGGLTADNIARIEILRGPQSTLHGSDAIGGVISITTKSGAKGFGGSAFMEGGVYNTVRGGGTARGGSDIARGSVTISGTRSDGISAADADNGNDERDSFRDINVASKGSVDVADNLTVSGALNVTEQRQEFDGFPFGSPVPVDSEDVGFTNRISGRVSATHTSLDGRLENEISVALVEIQRENKDGTGAVTFDADGERNSFEYQGTFDATEWLVVSFGAERQEDSFNTASPQFGTSDSGNSNTTSGFGLVQVTPIDRVTLTGGLRHDDSDAFGSETTARASAAVDIHETGTVVRGLWGEGFKAPTPFQLSFVCTFCAGPAVPNTNLEAETSESWEVGMDQTIVPGRLDAGITYFNQEIDNLIDFDAGGRGFENISETNQQGIEVTLDTRVTSWATLNASYTYLDAEDKQTGDQLVRRPRHRASGDIRFTPTDRLSVSTTITYQGKTEDRNVTLEDFLLVSLRGRYDVTDSVEVFARVENALDQDYQTAAGFGTPEASGFAGLRVSF